MFFTSCFIKRCVVFVFLVQFVSVFGQETLKVEYKEIYNTDSPRARSAIMQINPSNSVYVSLMQTTQLIKSEQELNTKKQDDPFNVNLNYAINVGSTLDDYYWYDLKNQKMQFISDIGDKRFSIQDTYSIKWQITNETKTIANFKTYKAITKFRGRIWEAWFAPDLAYPYGPWKLHCLPGLILEAYDTSKRYSYIATKIFKDDKNISFDVSKLPKLDFKTFTLQDFEFKDNVLSAPITRNTKVINYNEQRKGEEIEYEWEISTK